MPVQIVLDALPGSPYTGTLLEIDTTSQGNDSNYGGGATTYKAKVVFTKKPEDTILGAMTARLKIVLEEVFDVVLAPNIAISRGFEGTFVMKAEQGKYKKVPVELGLSDQANTEILTGLVKGDMIMGVFIDKEGMDVAGVNDDNTAMRAEGG
ncbi:MAG: efflux RND transporter periplasmic adaptor subunit [Candidatus Peribacteria bacterium]|jgi:multidrug efflux pump subunit AcrA (membrane-fusion protein)|nr:efflux RND transporter periplasmic adaptor subunit [Candidatus Peribacteria bacterium]